MEKKKRTNEAAEKKEYGYSDLFFEKGNYLLKIVQTLLSILGWICLIVPTFITISSFLYYLTSGKYGWRFWNYAEGILEIKFLLIIITFCVVITFTYAVSMTIIQNNRRESVIEKWPTFDSVSSIQRRRKVDEFMTERFGTEDFRHNVNYFEVAPEKNLETDELSNLLNKEKGFKDVI